MENFTLNNAYTFKQRNKLWVSTYLFQNQNYSLLGSPTGKWNFRVSSNLTLSPDLEKYRPSLLVRLIYS